MRLERYEKSREREQRLAAGDDDVDYVQEMEEQLYLKGKQLVEQSEKNYKVHAGCGVGEWGSLSERSAPLSLSFQLAERIRAMNDKVREKEQEGDALRAAMVGGIAGDDADPSRYSNVPLMDLLRLRCNKVDTGEGKVSFANTLARRSGTVCHGRCRALCLVLSVSLFLSLSLTMSSFLLWLWLLLVVVVLFVQSRAGTPTSDAGSTRGSTRRSASKEDEDATEVVPPGGVSKIMEAEREIKALRECVIHRVVFCCLIFVVSS